MGRFSSSWACSLALLLASVAVAACSPVGVRQVLQAAADSDFGSSAAVSLDGQVLAVAQNDDQASATSSVFIYRRASPGSNNSWVFDARIAQVLTSGPFAASRLHLNADGTLLLVGDPTYNSTQGRALVYRAVVSAGWTQEAVLTAPVEAGSAGNFGFSVALSWDGNTALVSAAFAAVRGIVSSGLVVPYKIMDGIWTADPIMYTPGGSVALDNFGSDVALSADGSVALFGALGSNRFAQSAGYAAFYQRSAVSGLLELSKVVAPVGADIERHVFGNRVFLSADGHVGAVSDNKFRFNTPSPGLTFDNHTVYVYHNTPSGWVLQDLLNPPHLKGVIAMSPDGNHIAALTLTSADIWLLHRRIRSAGWAFVNVSTVPPSSQPNSFLTLSPYADALVVTRSKDSSAFDIGCSNSVVCSATQFCSCLSSGSAPCPGGYYCSADVAAPRACLTGEFCPPSSAAPTQCRGGEYCPTLLAHSPVPCPAGFSCPVGASRALPCPAGTYCLANFSAPVPCSAGSYCAVTDQAPVECPAGTYCLANSTTTTPCPSGSYCVGGTSVPSSCNIGSYCPTGSSVPQACPPGFVCPSPSTRALCLAGSLCLSNSTIEVDCPAGSYCSTPGTVQVCDAGFLCPVRSTVPQRCPPSFFCTRNSSVAAQCPPGFFCGPNTSAPVACPASFFCPAASSSPQPCAEEKFTSGVGQSECDVSAHCFCFDDRMTVIVCLVLGLLISILYCVYRVSGKVFFFLLLSLLDLLSDVTYVSTQPFLSQWLQWTIAGTLLARLPLFLYVFPPVWGTVLYRQMPYLCCVSDEDDPAPASLMQRVAKVLLATVRAAFVFVLSVLWVVALLLVGILLFMLQLLALPRVSVWFLSVWGGSRTLLEVVHEKEAGDNVSAYVYHLGMIAGLLLESVPMLVLQVYNNQGDWNLISVVSAGLSLVTIINHGCKYIWWIGGNGMSWRQVPLGWRGQLPQVGQLEAVVSERGIIAELPPQVAMHDMGAGPTDEGL